MLSTSCRMAYKYRHSVVGALFLLLLAFSIDNISFHLIYSFFIHRQPAGIRTKIPASVARILTRLATG